MCYSFVGQIFVAHQPRTASLKKRSRTLVLVKRLASIQQGTDAPYPDRRARKDAFERGYNINHLSAQQLTPELAGSSSHIIVMDERNFADASKLITAQDREKLSLLLTYSGEVDTQLRDPFHSGSDGYGFIPNPVVNGDGAFVATIEKIEKACTALLNELR